MITLVIKTNQKNHVSFMSHVFSETYILLVNANILVKFNLLKNHDLL
jgi:hypothetical protein